MGANTEDKGFNRYSDDYMNISKADVDIDFDALGRGGEKIRGVCVDVTGTIVSTSLRGVVATTTYAAGVIHPFSTKRIASASTASGFTIYF